MDEELQTLLRKLRELGEAELDRLDEDADFTDTRVYPVLPVRDTVMFPHMVSPLFVGRDRSLKAVDAATANEDTIIVVAQRDPTVQEPSPEDLYTIGTEVEIVRMLRLPDGTTSILAQGKQRVAILDYVQSTPYFMAHVRPIIEPSEKGLSTEALMRAVLALFEKCVQLSHTIPDDTYIFAMNVDEPGWLADLVASTLELDLDERQSILETINPSVRLQRLSIMLARELDVLELENRIHTQVQQEVDRSQREYFLREQMKAIQNELGEGDAFTQEINELREKIADSDMPDEVREKAEKELNRLAAMPPMAPETGIIRTYLDWLLELPWSKATEDNMDIAAAARALEESHYGLSQAKDARALEESHYGLSQAKERILEYIAVRKLAADKMRSPILCFVGPPGTGKTSLGTSRCASWRRTRCAAQFSASSAHRARARPRWVNPSLPRWAASSRA